MKKPIKDNSEDAPKGLNLPDKELLQERKEVKKAKIMNAVLIGFFAGIIIWSIVKNTWGLVTLIPLFFIYKLVNKSEQREDK